MTNIGISREGQGEITYCAKVAQSERGDVYRHVAGEARRVDGLEHLWAAQVSLHTILPLPISFGVWHTEGGSGGDVYCAIVVRGATS